MDRTTMQRMVLGLWIAAAIGIVAPAGAENDVYEPNDGPDEAVELRPGHYPGLAALDEEDWFLVWAIPGQPIQATIDFTHAQGDLDMELYDDDLQLEDDSTTVDDDEEIWFLPAEHGAFYVVVYAYAQSNNVYDLTITGTGATRYTSAMTLPPMQWQPPVGPLFRW